MIEFNIVKLCMLSLLVYITGNVVMNELSTIL